MDKKPGTEEKIKIRHFDELFDYVGGLGVFQISHLFILCKYQATLG